jgi:addiction module RelE/StbE family toxin
MRIIYDSLFEKQTQRLPKPLRLKIRERVALLVADEFHPLLANHALHGAYRAYRSINITGDWRLVYRRLEEGSYYLRAIGTHHQLYGT